MKTLSRAATVGLALLAALAAPVSAGSLTLLAIGAAGLVGSRRRKQGVRHFNAPRR
ncbi:hypothetical protein [uncultured Lamprocystis sp.]|jgi:hypothetical protein|uniref:hypothetical protein n=1 Tax=uncultured Lamprocystis sp. TaxID=543132 RepID=UPI0025E79A49|nr:hypothetical protein [uncultured Lamprocystis sp.]